MRTIYRLVQVVHAGDEGLARCRNISDGGVALHLTMPVQLHDEISITFSPSVTLVGRVVWAKRGECGVAFAEPVDSRQLLSTTSAETHARGARAPRLRANVPAMIAFDGRICEALVRDISQSGIKLSHHGELTAGLKVKVSLGAGIEREGVVRWTRHNVAGLYFLVPLGVDELGSVRRLRAEASGKADLRKA